MELKPILFLLLILSHDPVSLVLADAVVSSGDLQALQRVPYWARKPSSLQDQEQPAVTAAMPKVPCRANTATARRCPCTAPTGCGVCGTPRSSDNKCQRAAHGYQFAGCAPRNLGGGCLYAPQNSTDVTDNLKATILFRSNTPASDGTIARMALMSSDGYMVTVLGPPVLNETASTKLVTQVKFPRRVYGRDLYMRVVATPQSETNITFASSFRASPFHPAVPLEFMPVSELLQGPTQPVQVATSSSSFLPTYLCEGDDRNSGSSCAKLCKTRQAVCPLLLFLSGAGCPLAYEAVLLFGFLVAAGYIALCLLALAGTAKCATWIDTPAWCLNELSENVCQFGRIGCQNNRGFATRDWCLGICFEKFSNCNPNSCKDPNGPICIKSQSLVVGDMPANGARAAAVKAMTTQQPIIRGVLPSQSFSCDAQGGQGLCAVGYVYCPNPCLPDVYTDTGYVCNGICGWQGQSSMTPCGTCVPHPFDPTSQMFNGEMCGCGTGEQCSIAANGGGTCVASPPPC